MKELANTNQYRWASSVHTCCCTLKHLFLHWSARAIFFRRRLCAVPHSPPSNPCVRSFMLSRPWSCARSSSAIECVSAFIYDHSIPVMGFFRCAPCSNTMKSISAHFSHHRVCDRAPLSQSKTRARYFFAIEQIRPCLQGDRVSLALGVSLILGIQIAQVYKQMEQSRDNPAVKDNSSWRDYQARSSRIIISTNRQQQNGGQEENFVRFSSYTLLSSSSNDYSVARNFLSVPSYL